MSDPEFFADKQYLQNKERLLAILLERSFKLGEPGEFTLSSGRKSDYYIDCRITTTHPQGIYLITQLILPVLSKWNIEQTGGLTLGADPIVSAIAYGTSAEVQIVVEPLQSFGQVDLTGKPSNKEPDIIAKGVVIKHIPAFAYGTSAQEIIEVEPLQSSAQEDLPGKPPIKEPDIIPKGVSIKPIPAFIVRKEAKGHGGKKLIEGSFEKGKRTAIIEDVITTGESALRAWAAAKEGGAVVVGVIAVVDREEGGKEAIEEKGLLVHRIFTATELKAAARKR